MKRRNLFVGIGSFLGMLALILDSRTALEGARQGVELCARTVVPSLFPFFVLSDLLVKALAGNDFRALRPVSRLCGMPEGSEAILVCGFLGGYPVGAQNTAAQFRQGCLSREEAERMLAFCNNAGPAFLFGIVGALFSDRRAVWVLWGIHILSALFTAAVLPSPSAESIVLAQGKAPSLPEALASGIRSMASVCGWVILFRVMIAFLNRWVLFLLPPEGQAAVVGLLELSNGCLGLADLPAESTRFLLCSVFLALGGICVAMQTMSVIAPLSGRYYFLGKALQGGFSFAMAAAFLHGGGLLCSISIGLGIFFLREARKRGSIRQAAGV